MLVSSILVVVSLSPVRGPGPRASRIAAIGSTWGRRIRVAVLVCGEHEDSGATLSALASSAEMEAWELPAGDHTPRFSQFKALKFAVERQVISSQAVSLPCRGSMYANDVTNPSLKSAGREPQPA